MNRKQKRFVSFWKDNISLKDEFTREYHQAVDLSAKRKASGGDCFSKQEKQNSINLLLNEQQQYEARATRIKEIMEQASGQLVELEQKYEDMKHKLKDMNIRRLELMGRENITRAQQQNEPSAR